MPTKAYLAMPQYFWLLIVFAVPFAMAAHNTAETLARFNGQFRLSLSHPAIATGTATPSTLPFFVHYFDKVSQRLASMATLAAYDRFVLWQHYRGARCYYQNLASPGKTIKEQYESIQRKLRLFDALVLWLNYHAQDAAVLIHGLKTMCVGTKASEAMEHVAESTRVFVHLISSAQAAWLRLRRLLLRTCLDVKLIAEMN